MSSPTFDYSGYLHVLCPICFWTEMKAWEEAVQPVVGVLFGGAYVLRCGHERRQVEKEQSKCPGCKGSPDCSCQQWPT